jgi:hypothetical protein
MDIPRLEGHVTPVLDEHLPLIQIEGSTAH